MQKMETPQGVKWGIHWKAPTTMVAFFLAGLATAVGHHVFYNSLKGKEVVETSSRWDLDAIQHGQEWKIRFGTALAFFTQSFFAMAIDVAFQQAVWVAVREKPISIGALDAMFSAGETIWSFFKFEFLRKANVGAVLGLLKWLIPVSALITPATLTVVQPNISQQLTMSVPSVDFSIVEPLYHWNMSIRKMNIYGSDNGITPYMSRILSSTATSAQILPMKAVVRSSTYKLTFRGPSLRCNPASSLIHEAIYGMTNASYFTAVGTSEGMRFENQTSWLAFAPTPQILELVEEARVGKRLLSNALEAQAHFLKFARTCIVYESYYSSAIFRKMNLTDDPPLCEGIAGFNPDFPKNIPHDFITKMGGPSPYEHLSWPQNYGRIWVWVGNSTTYDCVLTDTEYTVGFSYSASTEMQQIDPDYKFIWTADDLHGSYFATANAISTFLTGAILADVTGSGMILYRTRVTESAIFGALNLDPLPGSSAPGLSERVLIPEIRALARGKTVGELIEELSRNLTLSLFSAEKVLSFSSTIAKVTINSNTNVYIYNKRILIVTYTITCALALVAVLIGIYSLRRNGVSYDIGFLTFLLTTRNTHLDTLTPGESIGAMPHGKKVTDIQLRFGIIKGHHGSESSDDEEEDAQELTRVGFGFEEEVEPLVKGVGYR